jgi:hypothetical protein
MFSHKWVWPMPVVKTAFDCQNVKNGFHHRHRAKQLLTDFCSQKWFWPAMSFDCNIYNTPKHIESDVQEPLSGWNI